MKFLQKNFTATNTIIFITIVAYIVQTNVYQGTILFGLNLNFLQGFYWQPLTCIFSHGGVVHLGLNMFVLWQLGSLVEETRGKIRFLLLYLFTGVLTSLFTFLYIFYVDMYLTVVGASGAICAILGFVAYCSEKKQRVVILVWVILFSFAPFLIGYNIAWYSHLIGLVLGFIYAVIEIRFFPLSQEIDQ